MIDPRPVAAAQAPSPFELDAFIVRLEGEFDVSERARLVDAFAVAATSAAVVIDFKRARYVDSSVVECLVALQRALEKRGGSLLLVEIPSGIRRIFDVCGLDRFFSIRSTVGEVMSELDADATRVRRLTLIAEPTEAVEMDGSDLK